MSADAITLETLQRESQEISALYDAHFAGQSRHTRDLALLDQLTQRANDLLIRIDAFRKTSPSSTVSELRDTVQQNVGIYTNERQAIVDARAQGPGFAEFARLGGTANAVFAKYRRHFAGQSRGTRDLALLDEMIADLAQVGDQMAALVREHSTDGRQNDLKLVRETLVQYRTERDEVSKAQMSGTPAEQSDRQATLANNQFELYRAHFADQSRVTRRPELLERIMRALDGIKERMQSVRSSVKSTMHDENIRVVDSNMNMYRTELAEIRKARQATSFDDLVGNLGGTANEVFEQYRSTYGGKDRTTVDRAKLGILCDKLGEILRQMRAIDRAIENDNNVRNMGIVENWLAMLENEWDEIGKAQSAKR